MWDELDADSDRMIADKKQHEKLYQKFWSTVHLETDEFEGMRINDKDKNNVFIEVIES